MQRFVPPTLLILFMLIVAGCGVATPQASVTPAPIVEPAEATPTLAATDTEMAPEVAQPTATPTLGPAAAAQATAQALVQDVTLPTRTPAPTGGEGADGFVATFNKACQIVKENYVRGDFNGVDWDATCDEYRSKVEAADSQDEFWDLMAAFIAELNDDHSRFIPPNRLQDEFRLTPADEIADRPSPGFLVWPASDDERLKLWYVCDRGPAADAGLRRGDVILAINGEPVPRTDSRFDVPEIYRALYGEQAGAVTLTVQRGPEQDPEDIELAFGPVAGCGGWRWSRLSEDPHIGYVRVPEFSGDADFNILQAIGALEQDQALDGLVLDVRHNPGGNADKSIAVFTTGTFGEIGPLRDDSTQRLFRIRGPVRWNETTPVALLIDGNSHSAAEYFATAMKQSDRAILVGQPTAGNTEGIRGFALPDGSLIRLAVITLELPDGRTLEGKGVQPDIEVELGPWGLRQTPDIQVQAAYEALTGDPWADD